MVLIDAEKSDFLRQKYISTFVDMHSKFYKEHILKTKNCIDGCCYSGYLWECFGNFNVIDESLGENILEKYKDFYVFWDINSCEKILIPNYWKFPKKSFLKINYFDFISIKSQLPEDIYLFTDDMSFTIAFTHEYINGKRFCYWAYPN
jgi:hypothetical protein